jgi:very-short-patch-repair endonuclease
MFQKANPLIFAKAKQLRNNMTDAEIILWEYLRTKPLGYKFRRQHPIQQFIADFYCHSLQLIIEADGEIHQKIENKISDEERNKALNASGIKIIRFPNKEILNSMETVVAAIIAAIHEIESEKIVVTKIPY